MAASHSETALRQSAGSWVRPRRMLARLDNLAALTALIATGLLMQFRVFDLAVARLAHVVFQLLVGLVTLVLLYRAGQYSSDRRMVPLGDLAGMVKNLLLGFFFVCGIWLATDGFFTGYRDQSRLLLGSSLLVFFSLLVINRVLITWHQRRLFARGEGMRRVVVIGQGRVADNFVALLEERPWLGLRCAGTVAARGALSVERIQQLARADGPCEVVVALDPEDASGFDRVTMALTQAGMAFRVVPALFEASLHAARVYGFREPPVFDVLVDPLDQVRRSFKRAFDVVVSVLALLVVSPVLLVVAASVRFDSPGPIIFRQVRLGMGGRPFEILKFRTMVVDAERRLEDLKAQDEGDGPHFKMQHDPRITHIGAALRKWSLDELLQFVNVLRGDMSLVGPRPPLPREVDQYATEALIRLKGKPGITGLWQVSGRKDLAFEDMVRLDRHYVENWSLGMDLGIMVRTVGVVFARRGAY